MDQVNTLRFVKATFYLFVIIIVTILLAKNSSAQSIDVYEPDNTIDAANPINLGETQVHNLLEVRDEDWYKLILPEFGRVRVSLQNFGAQANIKIEMYDQISGGRGYGFSGTGGGPFPGDGTFLDSATLQYPGIYYLKITRFSTLRRPGDSTTYDYQVSFDYTPAPKIDDGDTFLPDAFEPDDWVSEATSLSGNVIQEHTFDTGDDRDWYIFSVTGCVKVLVEVASAPEQTIGIKYFDTSLEVIGSAESSTLENQVEYAFLDQDLRTGFYYVLVDRGSKDGLGRFSNEYVIRALGFQCDFISINPIINLLLSD